MMGVGPVAGPDVKRELGVRGDRAEELLRQLGVEPGDRHLGHLGVEYRQNGRPEMSIAHSPSDSSIGITACA